MEKIVTILQARMGSSRLPGKSMKLVRGKPLLWYSYSRASQSKLVSETIIATTLSPMDDKIAKWGAELSIPIFRGSETDVLDRYYHCAKKSGASVIVRLTADNPFCDPKVIDQLIEVFLSDSVDYVSNTLPPRTWPHGLDTEVFNFKSLETAFRDAKELYDHEHATPYLYHHPELFKLRRVPLEKDLSSYRLTVDYPEDFELCEVLINRFNADRLGWREIVEILKANPDIARINQSKAITT
ncbi:MAG TPA: glycosyltransferase family protein [Thermotogota bacterium]|jgi:spore coat polysaccharide biosynthesis protein SpsF|nr:glycosyltransferase family protein [Thermotogota bacterium]HPH11656.1 glycosyltransferase family protein [Thermotogota bacterium]HQQ66793.1 glycosyltransferase family protein [Thermotogota bacterium]